MNSSKRRAFKNSLINKLNSTIVCERRTDTCDLCHRHAAGTEHYHMNTPVLFVCDGCESR